MTSSLLDLPPRGLSLLHACQPEARTQIETLSDIVIASGLRRPALNILCSGDFGWDSEFLASLIGKYSQDGREAHVLFYLTDGPAARHWQNQPMTGFGSRLRPEEFRRRILSDTDFQKEYQGLAGRLSPLINQIIRAGGKPYIVPQLEDNQTDASFRKMLQLTKAALLADLPVRFGRNPCVSCYPGNEGSIPAGCFHEEHHHSASTEFTLRDGVLSNDGCTYSFADETPDFMPYLPLRNYAAVQSKTGDMDSIFFLWSAAFQGLGRTSPPPAERAYAMPTETEQQALLAFLQQP